MAASQRTQALLWQTLTLSAGRSRTLQNFTLCLKASNGSEELQDKKNQEKPSFLTCALYE